MIKATPAFGDEPWSKDNWRNRILLTVGERSWHLTREEAEDLSNALMTALEQSAFETFNGVVQREGEKVYLVDADDSRERIWLRDWQISNEQGKRVQIIGRHLEGGGIFLKEWSLIGD